MVRKVVIVDKQFLFEQIEIFTSLQLTNCNTLHIRNPSLPDSEQAFLYKKLGIDWKAIFPPVKTFAKP